MSAIERAIATVGGPTRMAEVLGVSAQAVCFWRDGKRRLPIEHCSAIERATNGAVTRKDLRPNDWQDIWPELADTQAPAEPAAAPHPPVVAAPEDEDQDGAPAQPMDLAGQCDNHRRADRRAPPEAAAGDDPSLQPAEDIDGESEVAPPLSARGLPADAGNGLPIPGRPLPPPPGFSGQDENGTPAAPAYQADDSEALLVLDDEDGKAV